MKTRQNITFEDVKFVLDTYKKIIGPQKGLLKILPTRDAQSILRDIKSGTFRGYRFGSRWSYLSRLITFKEEGTVSFKAYIKKRHSEETKEAEIQFLQELANYFDDN